MKVKELADKLGMDVITSHKEAQLRDVAGCYICDLLSWVIGRCKKDDIWITIQTNVNVVAVALLTECSCVIIPEGVDVEAQTIAKAQQNGVIILSAKCSSYQIAASVNRLIR